MLSPSPTSRPRPSADAEASALAQAQAHSNTTTTTTAAVVVGGANDIAAGAPAPAPAKKISFTRFTLAFNARHKTVPGPASPTSPRPSSSSHSSSPSHPAPHHPPVHHLRHPAPTHSPLHVPRAHNHSTHNASFQNLKPIFKAPPKPAPLPIKSKRLAPSPLSRFVSLPPPPPRRSSCYDSESESDDDSESDDESEDESKGGFGHMMGPCLVGSFRPPPPKPRYHGYSRSSFGLTKWVWATRLALGENPSSPASPSTPSASAPDSPISPDSPVSPTSPVSPVSPTTPTATSQAPAHSSTPSAPSSPTPRSPTDALPSGYPLTSPSFLRLRRARPALLEEEDNRPSEPPVTIYPRMGDLRCLHAEKGMGEKGKGEAWCVKVDRGFGGVGVWTLRKIVWIREVQEVQVRLKVQEAKGREMEEERSSASASESETEDEDEETLVDSDSEWDSVSTTCSSRQDSDEPDLGEREEGVLGKGNLIEMAVGRVNSAGKGGDERKGDEGEEVDVETKHMASSAWLCAFYRASAVVPSRAQRQGQRQGQMQTRVHVHSQMQWQRRWIVLLEIARRDGVRIKVVKAPSSSVGEMREKVGRDVRWLKLLGKSKAGVGAGAGKVVGKTVVERGVGEVGVEGVCDHHRYS
ncbi:hypothetical protein DFP72DRAFT_1045476 [Ephemerocybe angulata]|uniref:Uncharacterized protein n=1 Tax=Ephemerocybe angulata TaxID=980116 RepID=A0A8H6HZT1_9AGAR|nr:hypothetical protein DFP72DRAFT_1045476 [Tulosesus angulatus]